MQKILLQGIFVKLDIRINSNQKFWAEAEQTTSPNSYCNTWIEGEWFKNLLTQKYFTKKISYSKVFWPKICLNPNRFEPKFCLENVKKKHLNLLKKNIWSDFEWKNSLHRTWGGWNSLLTKLSFVLSARFCGTCDKNRFQIFRMKFHIKDSPL